MKITVAICTWNRARLLDQTLESLTQMSIPRGLDWELVVVDNNSTELAVPLVLNGFRKALPMVTAIEKEQGHSAARNLAIEMASGDYIVWTDNDVIVDPEWLLSYSKAFRDHPDVPFFGGEISPRFEEGRPDWIEQTWDICAPVYATRNLGDEAIELGLDKLPYGANFAIRSDVQKSHRYDTKWGRKASSMLGEDEVAVLRAIVESEGPGMWVPGARLEHVIPVDRASERYVASYYEGQGVAKALKGNVESGSLKLWWHSRWNQFCYRLFRNFSRSDYWVSKMVHAAILRGEINGLKLRKE